MKNIMFKCSNASLYNAKVTSFKLAWIFLFFAFVFCLHVHVYVDHVLMSGGEVQRFRVWLLHDQCHYCIVSCFWTTFMIASIQGMLGLWLSYVRLTCVNMFLHSILVTILLSSGFKIVGRFRVCTYRCWFDDGGIINIK